MRKVVEGIVTSRFGMRVHPVTKVSRMHYGVDVSAPAGTPIFCPMAGQVIICGCSPSEGNFVHVRCGGLMFVFMHLSSFAVCQSQMVGKGQQIGTVGKTGLATGNHLHFEVHINGVPVNPEGYINF